MLHIRCTVSHTLGQPWTLWCSSMPQAHAVWTRRCGGIQKHRLSSIQSQVPSKFLICLFVCMFSPTGVKICAETPHTFRSTEVTEVDIRSYLSSRNIQAPTTARETVSVAANILHTEGNENLARVIAKGMINGMRMSVPLFLILYPISKRGTCRTAHVVRAINRTARLRILRTIMKEKYCAYRGKV